MSAFAVAIGGKADMTPCGCLLFRSLLGVKRTWPRALHMSASDPKRTFTGADCYSKIAWGVSCEDCASRDLFASLVPNGPANPANILAAKNGFHEILRLMASRHTIIANSVAGSMALGFLARPTADLNLAV